MSHGDLIPHLHKWIPFNTGGYVCAFCGEKPQGPPIGFNDVDSLAEDIAPLVTEEEALQLIRVLSRMLNEVPSKFKS